MEKSKKRGISGLFTHREMDIPFLLIVLTILTVGIIMLFSASYTYAAYYKGGSTYYFIRQSVYACIGVAGMLIISKIDYKYLKPLCPIGFGIAGLLLVAVLFLPEVVPGFKRWILIPGIGLTFQPSEVAKMMLIMYCAWSMDRNGSLITSKKRSKRLYDLTKGRVIMQARTSSAFYYGGVVGITSVLVFLESHLSGTILMLTIGIVMLYLGGFNKWWFIIIGGGAVLVIAAVVIKPELLPSDYMTERIVAWKQEDYDPMGARWQINQSLYAIGSGGLLGTGLGNSMQKHLYVSEPQNDFIFSIVCEELGFVGSSIILVLFALLVWRGVHIGINAKDRFGALLAMGMSFQVGLQVFLNVAVVTDTVPNTGIGLPFFSAGGTSLCILLAEMGVVLGVSRYSGINKLGRSKKKEDTQEITAVKANKAEGAV